MSPAATIAQPVVFRRDLRAADLAAIRRIVESSGFFNEAEASVAVELAEERLRKGNASGYHFVFADDPAAGMTIGYTCYGEIACTVGSYDLYWIAVQTEHRGGGLGRRLMHETERLIARAGGRRVYVETAGRAQYEPTRAFYLACGYAIEATLPDFYAPGDAKVILCKSLDPPRSSEGG
jgi:ribosomal protein S18 acetylase RimI-like enzyme